MKPRRETLQFPQPLRDARLVRFGDRESLRQQERYKNLSVIAVTGSMDQAHLSRLRELGVNEIVIKARFKIDELLNRVKNFFIAKD